MMTANSPADSLRSNAAETRADGVPKPHAEANQSKVGLAQVQAVQSGGPEAVEQVADLARTYPAEWAEIASWLQQHRGNGFLTQVTAQMAQPTKPRKPSSTRYPIVLLHGLGAGPRSFAADIPKDLKEDGDQVFEATVQPYGTPQERAHELEPQLRTILALTGASKLDLIAWSEGGLDARYLISSMGWGDRVASLSTVGTPHHGSAAADKMVAAPGMLDAVLAKIQAVEALLEGQKDQVPATLGPMLRTLNAQLAEVLGRPLDVNLGTQASNLAEHETAVAGSLAARVSALARKLALKYPTPTSAASIAARMGKDVGNSMADQVDVPGAINSLTEAGAEQFNQANPTARTCTTNRGPVSRRAMATSATTN